MERWREEEDERRSDGAMERRARPPLTPVGPTKVPRDVGPVLSRSRCHHVSDVGAVWGSLPIDVRDEFGWADSR